jgi:hypothetical protein
MEESGKSKNFIKHVFNFEEDSKFEMVNIVQYSLIAIIPIVVLNKLMQKYVPEANEEKGSFEILAEVLVQIIVMFLGLLFIDRIITYFPTYSGVKYPDHSIVCIIPAVLIITLSLQTKLGEKVSILVERIMELWEGKKEEIKKKGTKQNQGQVKISQPISQNINQQAMNQAMYTDGTSINQLPVSAEQPNYDAMYRNDSTPLVGAATPQGDINGGFTEPMAANEAIGGSFGSW